MEVIADFHNHSCLSPCASLEMSPNLLVQLAGERGVQVLALTDHNSALNTPAFEILCRKAGLLPLCGLEVTTVEELHCLCLFPTADEALAFGQIVEAALLKIPNRPEKWGDQPWVDSQENIQGEVPFWLGAATSLSLSSLGEHCLASGGLWIPAHVDRPSQSVSSQLGYLPPGAYSALEVREGLGHLKAEGIPLVRGSDAHYPENIAGRTCRLTLESWDFEGVRNALRHQTNKERL